MFDNLSIVIPFRPINEERQVIFDWVYRRTLQTLPGAEVIVSSDVRNDRIHFSRSMAINEGVLRATRANICAMDADLIIDPDTFVLGLESLKKFSMTTLMSQVRYLSKETSDKLLKLSPKQSITELEMSSPHIVGQYPASVGGAVMFHRDKFIKMGGFDERLVGWGYEDNVFHATYSAFFGAPDRLRGYIYHIHHSHAAVPSETDYNENNYFQNEYRLIVSNNPVENNKKIWEEYCKFKDSPSDLLDYIRRSSISPFKIDLSQGLKP